VVNQITLPKNAALKFGSGSVFVSEHNRAPVSLTFERIETRVRTQKGSLRKYYRADKRSLSCSWNELPKDTTTTVDAGWGAKDLETFFKTTPGSFPVLITHDTGITETITMIFTDFSIDLVNRSNASSALYAVSLSLEEV
jgi:hypothetical protein